MWYFPYIVIYLCLLLCRVLSIVYPTKRLFSFDRLAFSLSMTLIEFTCAWNPHYPKYDGNYISSDGITTELLFVKRVRTPFLPHLLRTKPIFFSIIDRFPEFLLHTFTFPVHNLKVWSVLCVSVLRWNLPSRCKRKVTHRVSLSASRNYFAPYLLNDRQLLSAFMTFISTKNRVCLHTKKLHTWA